MKKIFYVLVLFGVTFFNAQEQETQIDSIVIQGRSKIKKEISEFRKHAQSTEALSEYELNRNTANFIEQSLGTLAGVQVDKRTTLGGQRIVVRGYGNDQKFNNWGVKMYLNNFPLTGADGVTILEDVDFSLINHIDVVKGPVSTLYGGGAGGTLKFYIRPETKKGTSLSQKFMAGSFNTLQSATRIDAVSDRTSVMVNYNHFQSDGYRPRGNSNRNNYTFLGNFKITEMQNLEVYASHNNSFEGVPGQISYADYYAGIDNGNLAYARRNAANKFISTRFSVGHQWKFNPAFENKTHIYYGNLDVRRKAAGAFENSSSPMYGVRSTFIFNQSLGDHFKNNLEFGAEYSISKSLVSNYRYTGTNPDIPEEMKPMKDNTYFSYHNYAATIFAVNRLIYQPWKISLLAGLGMNRIGYDRSDLLAEKGLITNYKDKSFQKDFRPLYSPHVALQKVYKTHVFNLSYSEGLNAPTAATAFIAGTGATNDQLKPEKAKMWDISAQGVLFNTRFDYQMSLFSLNVTDKLTQLSAGSYSYWANTGKQLNKGFELSLGYVEDFSSGLLKRIEPYINFAHYNFKYTDFVTGGSDYSGKRVVGIPRNKLSFGLDFHTKDGIYLYNTFNIMDDVHSDFANQNKVKGYHQLNSKLGYRRSLEKLDLEAYVMGNNLTSQINYTFLFLGNSVGDNDPDSQYPANVATDITPGSKKTYFFGGLNLKYRF